MNSWATLEALLDNLEIYLDSNYSGYVPFLFEHNPLDLQFQDERSDIAGMRISLYEEPEDVLIRTGASKAKDFDQAYQMQLFLRVSRDGDPDYIVEQELMNVKDLVYAWQDQTGASFDVASITSNELYTFEWNSVNRITRDRFFSALEINFAAYRGLL